MIQRVAALLIFLLPMAPAAACGSGDPAREPGEIASEDETRFPGEWLSYSDGNANRFVARRDERGTSTFRYRPVLPGESSSGVYSGASEIEGVLGEEDVPSLRAWVAQLEAVASRGRAGRTKGTAQLRISDGAGVRSFQVRSDASWERSAAHEGRDLSPASTWPLLEISRTPVEVSLSP